MTAEVVPFERADGMWDWNLVADNGEVLCGTVQGFRDEHDAFRNALTVRTAFMNMGPPGVPLDPQKDPSDQPHVAPTDSGPFNPETNSFDAPLPEPSDPSGDDGNA